MLARFFVLLVFHVNLILSVTDTEQDIICTLSGEGFLNRFIANTAFYNLHSEQDVAAVTSECNNYVALKVSNHYHHNYNDRNNNNHYNNT